MRVASCSKMSIRAVFSSILLIVRKGFLFFIVGNFVENHVIFCCGEFSAIVIRRYLPNNSEKTIECFKKKC